MSRWELEETREHISRLFGREQLELANPCIRSVVDRQTYTKIHYQNARAKIDAYVQTALQEASLIEITFGSSEAWTEFNVFIREVAAHLTACVQSMHAVPDILSHVVYYTLGLNRKPTALKPRNLGVKSVLKLLKREAKFPALSDLLNSFITGGSFNHLAALANQAKHRSIVFPSLSEDGTGKRKNRHSIIFPAFSYEGTSYPQVQADDFLRLEYERGSKLVIDTGIELNALLQRLAP